MGYGSPGTVFAREQEALLVAYILKAAKFLHGLTPSDIQSLVHDFAKANGIKCPDSWFIIGIVGVD